MRPSNTISLQGIWRCLHVQWTAAAAAMKYFNNFSQSRHRPQRGAHLHIRGLDLSCRTRLIEEATRTPLIICIACVCVLVLRCLSIRWRDNGTKLCEAVIKRWEPLRVIFFPTSTERACDRGTQVYCGAVQNTPWPKNSWISPLLRYYICSIIQQMNY